MNLLNERIVGFQPHSLLALRGGWGKNRRKAVILFSLKARILRWFGAFQAPFTAATGIAVGAHNSGYNPLIGLSVVS